MRKITNVSSDAAELVVEDEAYWDYLFRDAKGRIVEPVSVQGAPIADTHCHLDMLPHPELAIARAAYHGIRFLVTVVDPTEEPEYTYQNLPVWLKKAEEILATWEAGDVSLPYCRVIIGCHPHNAAKYDDGIHDQLLKWACDPLTAAIGEIGLDYHYDASPREKQREAFIRQLGIAKQQGLPVALHLRDAHLDGYDILQQTGWPEAGVLLHCFTLGMAEAQPFLQKNAQVALGGTMTFNKADELREAVRRISPDRIMTETDAPFMTPTPLRGTLCGPEHTLFTAAFLADLKEARSSDEAQALLGQVYNNALRFFRIESLE
ncbi:MAG: TatD family hydrolase [Coriobacteriia bacterium]|nr:TatD family hydrolase [Coriobacteriia bacterium]